MKLDAYDDEGRCVGEVIAEPNDTRADLLRKLRTYREEYLGLETMPSGDVLFHLHDSDYTVTP